MEEDSILFSQSPKKGLRLSRATLKGRVPLSQSLREDLGKLDEEDEDSVVISSQQARAEKKKRASLLLKRQEVHKDPKKVLSPLSRLSLSKDDDSVAGASSKPSPRKKLERTKKLGLSSSSPLSCSIKSPPASSSPLFESTRIQTPLLSRHNRRRLSTAAASPLNLSQKSLYQKRLTTQQLTEGGTQMTPQRDPQEDAISLADLSIRSVYKKLIGNAVVAEGATQTTPLPNNNNEEENHEKASIELQEAMEEEEIMDSSLSTVVSNFVPREGPLETESFLAPLSAKDFGDPPSEEDRAPSPPRKTNVSSLRRQSNVSSPRRKSNVSSPQRQSNVSSPRRQSNVSSPRRQSNVSSPRRQSNVSSPRRQSNVSSPRRQSNVSSPRRQSNVSSTRRQSNVSSPQRPSINGSKTHLVPPEPLMEVDPSDGSVHHAPTLFCPSESEEEEEEKERPPEVTFRRLSPQTFKRRYGASSKEETGDEAGDSHARRRNLRKSIAVKKRPLKKADSSQFPVSLQEGYEHFSRYCPFKLNKEAETALHQVGMEVIGDIMERLTDEVFYSSGRTNVSLPDVKNVMLQYKCFPPTPHTAKLPNMHLYNFLIHNCDDKASKMLIPMTSFDRKKDKDARDIWAESIADSPQLTKTRKAKPKRVKK